MKNIKKILLLLLILTLALSVFAGCESLDVESAATVTVKVNSPASDITLKSSRGKVSKSGKTFTISLENRATFNYSVSANDYETYYAEINALDLKDIKNLDVNVTLATEATAVVTLNVANKEKIEITSSNDKAKITSKGKTHTIILPGRGKSGETTLSVSGENLETKNINITADQIKSGYYFSSAYLTKENTVQVEIKNAYSESLTSLNYNVYDSTQIDSVSYFSIPRGEEFLIRGKYFEITESSKTYDDFVFDDNNSNSNIELKNKLFVDAEAKHCFNRVFVETPNGFQFSYILENWYENGYKNYIPVDKPGRVVLFANKDGMLYKYELTFTQEDLTSQVEMQLTHESSPIIPGISSEIIYKNINEETGEEIISDSIDYEKYAHVDNQTIFDGNDLINISYYRTVIEIHIPFETKGLKFDIVDAYVYYGNKKSDFSLAEYKDGVIIVKRGLISYNELLAIEVSFQKRIQIDEYNYVEEEVARERIVQKVNENCFVKGKYISNIKETLSKYRIINEFNYTLPNEVEEYGINNGYNSDWKQNIEVISGEFLHFEDWLTNSKCYRLTNETVFKIVYNPMSYEYLYVTLRTNDEFTLKTLPKNFENLTMEILVPFELNV